MVQKPVIHPILNFLFSCFGLPLWFPFKKVFVFAPVKACWRFTFFAQCPLWSHNQSELSHVFRTFSFPHSKSWLYSSFWPCGCLFVFIHTQPAEIIRCSKSLGVLTVTTREAHCPGPQGVCATSGEPSLSGPQDAALWVLALVCNPLWILWVP